MCTATFVDRRGTRPGERGVIGFPHIPAYSRISHEMTRGPTPSAHPPDACPAPDASSRLDGAAVLFHRRLKNKERLFFFPSFFLSFFFFSFLFKIHISIFFLLFFCGGRGRIISIRHYLSVLLVMS